MDERTWSKARNLASAFSEAYDEDVATVLGEALLESLAGLLVPEDEKPSSEDLKRISLGLEPEGVAEAKAQHPAYSPVHVSGSSVRPMVDPYRFANLIGCGNPILTHPEFLEGQAAYEAAPVGTLVECEACDGRERAEKRDDGWYQDDRRFSVTMRQPRRVLRWGPA